MAIRDLIEQMLPSGPRITKRDKSTATTRSTNWSQRSFPSPTAHVADFNSIEAEGVIGNFSRDVPR